MNDVAIYAVAGVGVQGYAAGTTLALGFGGGLWHAAVRAAQRQRGDL